MVPTHACWCRQVRKEAAAKKNALMIERLLMMDAVTGEEVANIPCDARFEQRFGNPYAVAHRAHIHGPLLDACRAHELIERRRVV